MAHKGPPPTHPFHNYLLVKERNDPLAKTRA